MARAIINKIRFHAIKVAWLGLALNAIPIIHVLYMYFPMVDRGFCMLILLYMYLVIVLHHFLHFTNNEAINDSIGHLP